MKQLFVYKKWVTKKGRTVENELCCCGALLTEHGPSLSVPHSFFGRGHGPCPRTKCKKFTWEDFVYTKHTTPRMRVVTSDESGRGEGA